MNFETQLLHRLKAAQANFALEALQRPAQRDAFEYGHRVGVVDGYEASINLLMSMLEEEKRK
jgi:hypothetical protein